MYLLWFLSPFLFAPISFGTWSAPRRGLPVTSPVSSPGFARTCLGWFLISQSQEIRRWVSHFVLLVFRHVSVTFPYYLSYVTAWIFGIVIYIIHINYCIIVLEHIIVYYSMYFFNSIICNSFLYTVFDVGNVFTMISFSVFICSHQFRNAKCAESWSTGDISRLIISRANLSSSTQTSSFAAHHTPI